MCESNEPLFRFSLRMLAGWIVFLAVACAGIVTGGGYWQSLMNAITVALLCGALVLGIASRESKRVFYLAFVVFLVAHSLAVDDKLNWLNIEAHEVATYRWVEMLVSTVHDPHTKQPIDPHTGVDFRAIRLSRYRVAGPIGHQTCSITVAAIAAYLMRAIYVYSNRKRANE